MSDEERALVGVRFKEAGKVYYFDAEEHVLDVGNYVVVETSHGLEIGRVVISPDQVLGNEHKEQLKPIVRIATPDDLEGHKRLRDRAAENLRTAKSAVARDGIDMQIISGEYDLDGNQLTFYFTSQDRVDFRALTRELSSEFGARVQFLQVGDRDRAKVLDGYDVCGQRLCCSSWQVQFPAVSIKMAKEQDLPLNPQKISGVCGRLYCCLTFEFEAYRELRGQLPKQGAMVSTPVGEARVNKVNVIKKTVTLWLTEQKQVMEMPAADLQMQYGLTVRPLELVTEIEAPLKESGEASAPEQTSAAPQAAAAGEGEERRKRRGRRGGRGRRKPGGAPEGGGDSVGPAPASDGPPGPPSDA